MNVIKLNECYYCRNGDRYTSNFVDRITNAVNEW